MSINLVKNLQINVHLKIKIRLIRNEKNVCYELFLNSYRKKYDWNFSGTPATSDSKENQETNIVIDEHKHDNEETVKVDEPESTDNKLIDHTETKINNAIQEVI